MIMVSAYQSIAAVPSSAVQFCVCLRHYWSEPSGAVPASTRLSAMAGYMTTAWRPSQLAVQLLYLQWCCIDDASNDVRASDVTLVAVIITEKYKLRAGTLDRCCECTCERVCMCVCSLLMQHRHHLFIVHTGTMASSDQFCSVVYCDVDPAAKQS